MASGDASSVISLAVRSRSVVCGTVYPKFMNGARFSRLCDGFVSVAFPLLTQSLAGYRRQDVVCVPVRPSYIGGYPLRPRIESEDTHAACASGADRGASRR